MAELDLRKFLDKAHEQMSIDEVLKLPPSALQGVSEGDAEALEAAFGIKTIADMGKNKHFKVAQSLLDMSTFGGASAK